MPGRARSGGRCLISSNKGTSHSLLSRLKVMDHGMTAIRRRRRAQVKESSFLKGSVGA